LNLHPTRSSVAVYHAFRPKGWEQQKEPLRYKEKTDENVKVCNKFFKDNKGIKEKIGNNEHTFVRNCSTAKVIKLLQQLKFSDLEWDRKYYVEYLQRLFVSGNLNEIDVVLMSNGNWRNRSLVGGQINNLLQGPYPSNGSQYPGDRNFHGDRVQIQIHYVTCLDDDQNKVCNTVAVALYLPQDSRFDMSHIIRGDLL